MGIATIITPDGSSWRYVYQYRDHVDNIRLSYSDGDGNGTISQSEIIQENNYQPFGLKMRGFNNNTNSLGNSMAERYMFGGKEFDDSFNETLNTYDFGARNYDPALGRWMNLDPLAEQMRRHSPYNYAFNNPIYFIDPDGMAPEGNNPIKRLWALFKATSFKSVTLGAGYKVKGGTDAIGLDNYKVAYGGNIAKFSLDLDNWNVGFSALEGEAELKIEGYGMALNGSVAETEKELGSDEKASSSFISLGLDIYVGEAEVNLDGKLFGKNSGDEKGYVVDGDAEVKEQESKSNTGISTFEFQAILGFTGEFDLKKYNEYIKEEED